MRPPHSMPNHGQQNVQGQQSFQNQQPMTGPAGIRRDGNSLVVDTRRHVFQQRCVKTNQEYSGGLTRVFCRDQPNDMMRFLIGGVVYLLLSNSKSVMIQIPLCQEYLKKRTRNQVIGYSAIAGSIILILALSVGYVMFMVSDNVMGVAIVLLPIMSLFGMIFLAITNRPILGLKKYNEHYVWLTGADPDYLDSLPSC